MTALSKRLTRVEARSDRQSQPSDSQERKSYQACVTYLRLHPASSDEPEVWQQFRKAVAIDTQEAIDDFSEWCRQYKERSS